jgi:hypothetical protein
MRARGLRTNTKPRASAADKATSLSERGYGCAHCFRAGEAHLIPCTSERCLGYTPPWLCWLKLQRGGARVQRQARAAFEPTPNHERPLRQGHVALRGAVAARATAELGRLTPCPTIANGVFVTALQLYLAAPDGALGSGRRRAVSPAKKQNHSPCCPSRQHATPTRGGKRRAHLGSINGDERLLCYSNYETTKLRIFPFPSLSFGPRAQQETRDQHAAGPFVFWFST